MLFAAVPLILIPVAKYVGSALVGAGIAWWISRGGSGPGGGRGPNGTNTVENVTQNVRTSVVEKIGFDYVVDGKKVGGLEDFEVAINNVGTNVWYDLSQLKESPESFEKVSALVRKVGAAIVP